MSVALANAAKARVWHFWGAHIPAALRNVPASEIFNFHAIKASYDIAFSSTWVRTFRTANAMDCRAGDTVSGGVDAFVSADDAILDRKVHVSPGGLSAAPHKTAHDNEAMLAHEYIHWLSHPNFYPIYYRTGGDNPFRVEGFTEWLMIECYPPGAVNIVYVAQYQKTVAWLAADPANRGRLLQFIFQGVASDLSALHP
jgi:hypothetical protein